MIFIDEEVWKCHDLDSFCVFKFHFGDWFICVDCQELHGYDFGYKLVCYKNIDELNVILVSVSSCVIKDDVFLDLLFKFYSKCYFDFLLEQDVFYCQLRDEFEVELLS